jgi:CBS domain-containing protein
VNVERYAGIRPLVNGGNAMQELSLNDMMLAEPAVMEITEPVSHARRRIQAEALHSIVVLENDRPVGVVETRHLRGITTDDLTRPVSDFMVREFPKIPEGTSPDQAVELMGHDVEVDRIPVVRDDGTLAGVITRETLLKYRDHGSETVHVDDASMGPVSAEAGSATVGKATHDLRQGMSVKDSSGSNLGSISDIELGRARQVEFFTVEYGLIFKNHKRLTADLIRDIDGDDVYLLVESTEFKMMPDLEDQVQ